MMNTDHPKKCPSCGCRFGKKFHQVLSGGNVIGRVYGEDRARTVGQQAEINAKRLGKEQLQLLAEAQKQKTPWTGPTPKKGVKPKEGAAEAKPQTPWWRDGSVPGLPKLDKPLKLIKIKDTKKYIEEGQ